MKDMVYFQHASLASSGCAQVPAPGHHCVETQDCCAYPSPQVTHNESPHQEFCTHVKMHQLASLLPQCTHLLHPTIMYNQLHSQQHSR